jgi:hypothetical protein
MSKKGGSLEFFGVPSITNARNVEKDSISEVGRRYLLPVGGGSRYIMVENNISQSS